MYNYNVPYYRCRRCGSRSPIDSQKCINNNCQADLLLYGDIVDPRSPSVAPSQTDTYSDFLEKQRREEERRRLEQERRMRQEEARLRKEIEWMREQLRLGEEERRRQEEARQKEEERQKEEQRLEEDRRERELQRKEAGSFSPEASVRQAEGAKKEAQRLQLERQKFESENLYSPPTDTVTLRPVNGTDPSFEKAFDGKKYTDWCVTGFDGAFVIFKALYRICILSLRITVPLNNSSFPGRCPLVWTLYATNSGDLYNEKVWDAVLKSPERNSNIITRGENGATYVYTLKNGFCTTAYSFYKLVISETVDGGSVMHLSNIALEFYYLSPEQGKANGRV